MAQTSLTTTMHRDELVSLFLDGTTEEVYAKGRLITRDEGEGVTSLIAYGWNKIAEYDEKSQTVTIFAGHSGNVSKTVTGYVNTVEELAGLRENRRRNVVADAAPNVERPPAESVRFIDNYRSFVNPSSVEEWATEKVEAALLDIVSRLL